MQASYLPGI